MSVSSAHAPLVWFTSLAIGGAGIVAADARHLHGGAGREPTALAIALCLLLAGIVVSTLHLGRRSRALRAALGVGRSPLSHEIILAGATVAAAAVLVAPNWTTSQAAVCRGAAGAVAVLFLLSIGLVYRLGGQLTWGGPAIIQPLAAGLACGEVFLVAINRATHPGASAALLAIAADAALFAFRRWTLVRRPSSLTRPGTSANRLLKLSDARPVLFNVLPALLLISHAPVLALAVVAAGLVFDRWVFYALAVQHTTEAEMARVEAIIERDPGIG